MIEANPGTLREAAALKREAERALIDREVMADDFRLFARAAFQVIQPHEQYVHGWHLDAISDKLVACSSGEIRRLQIWVPPGTMKSLSCSIFWPAWEWIANPWLRFLTGSYDIDLATDFAMRSRDVVQSEWYQARWGDKFTMKTDLNLKRSYGNNEGGRRYATSPTGGATGRHAHRIIIDDPLNAKEALSEERMDLVGEWHDGTLTTRWADPSTGVEVLVNQRLHERDLAGRLLEKEGNEWEVLCLPEEYEPKHPFVWPEDPRSESGDLLWPERITAEVHAERVRDLGSFRASGQLQQRPSSPEGDVLKRADWRYYDREMLKDTSKFPRFSRIVDFWDTTYTDKTTSDFVVGTKWGVTGSKRYLLRRFKAQVDLGDCITAMKESRAWSLERFPHSGHTLLIENTANGPAIIVQIKNAVTGVQPVAVKGDKMQRAIAASPDLEAGDCLLPGKILDDLSGPDPQACPAWVMDFVEECAKFDKGAHDDDVDSFSGAINWIRTHSGRGGASRPKGTLPAVGSGSRG